MVKPCKHRMMRAGIWADGLAQIYRAYRRYKCANCGEIEYRRERLDR